MITRLKITGLCTFIAAGLFAGDIPVSLNYRSFYDQVIRGDITEFTIYKNYRSDVHAVAKDAKGQTYIVGRPYRYEEDHFLIEYLKEKRVQVTILDDTYQGPLPEKGKHKNYMLLAGSLFYLIPLALILAIVFMAKAIARQAKVIESFTKNSSTGD